MSLTEEVTTVVFLLGIYLLTPMMLIWGWIRWTRKSKIRTISSVLSLSGFVLATASAALAICSIVYAHVYRPGFYDPSLMKFMRWGLMISVAGLLSAAGGAWRKNSIQWHAPICAFGMCIFWIMAVEGE